MRSSHRLVIFTLSVCLLASCQQMKNPKTPEPTIASLDPEQPTIDTDSLSPEGPETNYLPEPFTGFVSDVQGDSILVFSQHGLITFSVSADIEAEVGDRILLEFNQIAESYPGQAQSKKAQIVTPPREDNQMYSEKEAILLAFDRLSDVPPVNDFDYRFVTKTNYDFNADKWSIFIDLGETEPRVVDI